MKNLLKKGLEKNDPIHKFCIGCRSPFLNLFFNEREKSRAEILGLKKSKNKGCGCGK